MLKKTQVCHPKTWIKETLSLSKARGAITVDILLLKYQKQAVAAALNGQYNHQISKTILLCCYLMPWESRGYTKYCFLLSVGTFHQSEIKFLIGKFTWVSIMNFIPDWESDFVHQSGLQTNSSGNWCYCAKMTAL